MASGARVCKFYKQGRCAFGDDCRFKHEEGGGNDPWTRQWTSFGDEKESDASEFSVLSCNLLAQSLADPALYARSSRRFLSWPVRRRLALDHLKAARCDVLVFQEFDEAWFAAEEEFNAALEGLGYTGTFTKRTGDKKDGCAIYFKAQMFELVERESVFFKEHPDPLMDRDNIAHLLLLRHRASEKTVCVASTHLLFNPKRGDVKLMQLNHLLERLENVRETHQCSTVLCGDFNFTPDSALYHYLFTGSLSGSHLDRRNMSGQTKIIKQLARGGKSSIRYWRAGHAGSGSFTGKYMPVTPNSEGYKVEPQTQPTTSRKKGPSIPVELPTTLRELSHSLELSSAYACGNTSQYHTGEPAVTQFHPSFAGTVDYICYDRTGLKVTGILELPKPSAYWGSSLPCKRWGSDHLSIASKFTFLSES